MLCWKQDDVSNQIGRFNQNPILKTCLYGVEFPGEEIIELAANIIKESMYVQCDVDWNEYLLLEAFINHRKNGSSLSIEDQKIVLMGKRPLESQQLVGTFVANGRTVPHCGRSYPT